MPERMTTMIEGNEAVAHVAYNVSEVIAIYPITPSSAMGEYSDAWSASNKVNIWGTVPSVIEMQSEGGAAGAVHGSLQTGSLTTTFTASQGLLLMIPNMYKIAGELTPFVMHVAARSIAAQGLSIFGDHSDVMAVRATGFSLLASNSVQEAHDLALIAHAATLKTRVPMLHFFDGFRTSHEINQIELATQEQIAQMIDEDLVFEFRNRALSPDRPVLRGTAQNPDVYFQARETVNPFYLAAPEIIQATMDKFAGIFGRQYKLYEYYGSPDAERVIVMMGSGAEAAHETVDYLMARGEKVGVLKVRMYRPFSTELFARALPASVKKIAVLDRNKEPGAGGEPLYLDVVNALHEAFNADVIAAMPKIIGGRYGLSSKEFTPAMVKAVFDNLSAAKPKNHFTVGINDDVTNTSLEFDPHFSIEPDDVIRAMFYGLGSDGTVGANKNSIKIIGDYTPNFGQGYFVYDSKKSGAVTISHLRFGPRPIRSTYLITKSNFIACHQTVFLERYDMLKDLVEGGVFLLNTPYGPNEVWDTLPRSMQEAMIAKKVRFYVIDAYHVAGESGMRGRINTVMQTCFFAIAGVLSREDALSAIKDSIVKTYGKRGEKIVQMNIDAVDSTVANLFEVTVPQTVTALEDLKAPVPAAAPAFVREVLGAMIAQKGDQLPVSKLPVDGTYPVGTTKWEKRNLALEIPVWDPDVCIQCGKCAMVCPHAVIRIKAYDGAVLENAPETFKHTTVRDREWEGMQYTIQVAPEDCTGCAICVDVCPAKNKSALGRKAINMEAQPPLREQEAVNWDFFLDIPEMDRTNIKINSIRQQQVQQPLFEFSGACSGCGETPYIKLVTQLFGDRTIVANATGCSSIYGGNLPTTPWTKNAEGRGPAWSNSLFEDNAEFGLGMRVSLDKQRDFAFEMLQALASEVGQELVTAILDNPQKSEADIYEQRESVAILKERLAGLSRPEARRLLALADMLVRKTVWIIGGDGWAYDIDYGGLDHVLASGSNVNVLVMDTEVYSNTGGQASKATPRGAVAKFAAGGKRMGKKDLGLIAMTYGNIYVARVAMGARDEQTLRAFIEAEAYEGPSLIIAYSHCIAHGINMATAMQNQKAAVESGQWLLYRFNPDRALQGENPLQLDSRPPKIPVKDYLAMESRFSMLNMIDPERAKMLQEESQRDVENRWAYYEFMAQRTFDGSNGNGQKS
ncbi:MAG TPA: pyruvate:ferredoxin (flavodoxin) oxidoreductase [Aggregatilineales bacterium]|nr:pyruvate:ferredoxin (flavodoxin) oxidoreductase [Aggregatilineales bacterium]